MFEAISVADIIPIKDLELLNDSHSNRWEDETISKSSFIALLIITLIGPWQIYYSHSPNKDLELHSASVKCPADIIPNKDLELLNDLLSNRWENESLSKSSFIAFPIITPIGPWQKNLFTINHWLLSSTVRSKCWSS